MANVHQGNWGCISAACKTQIQRQIQIQIQAIKDASALHAKHKLLLDSYFLEKGAKPFIGE